MLARRLLVAAFALAPLALATLDGAAAGATPTGDASAGPVEAGPAIEASSWVAPDPTPLVTKDQWVFDLRWDKGDVYLIAVHPLVLPAPQATPRALGRFALELYEGRTLVERVRFDFPLLGAPEIDGGIRFTRKLTTRIGVMFPQSKRGTLLELVDRSSGQRWRLPWPPEVPTQNVGDASPD